MKRPLSTDHAPAAIGPYSQGIRTGNLVFVSGQLPVDPATGAFAGADIETQTAQSLKNIQAILAVEGLDLSHVVKTTVFLQDMEDFAAMNQVYAAFFDATCPPARAAVQAARLPKDARVEIEAIAAD